MSYESTLEYIHNIKWQKSKPGLSRTIELLAALGNPEKKLKFVHIAGTNGKGSCAAMLHSILKKAGYKTGLYTSPHILKFNERIIINGNMVEDDELVKAFNAVYEAIDEENQLTFFEFTTLAALYTFKNNNVNYIILFYFLEKPCYNTINYF